MHAQELVVPADAGTPELFHHGFIREHLPGVAAEQGDDLILVRRQVRVLSGEIDAVLVVVHAQLAHAVLPRHGQRVARAVGARVAQRRADARQQLHRAEGLGEIVVRPHVERGRLVKLRAARRDDDDRHPAPRTDGADDLTAVHVRQTEIQQQQIRAVRGDHLQRRPAVGREQRLVIVTAQRRLQVFADAGIVLDDDDFVADHVCPSSAGSQKRNSAPPPTRFLA